MNHLFSRLLTAGLLVQVVLLSGAVQAQGQKTEPKTLDLTQNAAAAFNAITHTVDDKGEFIFSAWVCPPWMEKDGISFAACGPKYVESLAMMSLMTGLGISDPAIKKVVDYPVSCIEEDGLFYAHIGPDRPNDKTSPEDYANIYGQARMMRAMIAMYQLSGDKVWAARIKKMASKLKEIAIRKVDPETGQTYAYYPTTPGYGDIFSYPKSGWKTTELLTGAQENMADLPDHSFGIPLYIGGIVEPLVRYSVMFDDKEAVELAGQIVNLLLKKEMVWMPDGHAQGVIPEQSGQYFGHFHGHTVYLRGISEYAIATNNTKLKNLARASYEYSRTFGIPRLGWFPEYTGKLSHETCGLANMVAIAVKLSDAGVGDYWEDVDCYARNHLTEAQFTDRDKLLAANIKENKGPLDPEKLTLMDGLVGVFAGWGDPDNLSLKIMNCCTANGSQALYYVWDSIVREKNAVVSVNLLMNRRSKWLDVESSLPYKGEVIIRNKNAKQIAIRVPNWVDKDAVKLMVNKHSVKPVWVGNYVIVSSAAHKDVIGITFPVKESLEDYCVDSFTPRTTNYHGRTTYRIHFRGNTATQVYPISKPGVPDELIVKPERQYPIYDDRFKSDGKVPAIPVPSYVAEKRLDW